MEGSRTCRTNKWYISIGTYTTAPNYLLCTTIYPLKPGHYVLYNYGWDSVEPPPTIPTSLSDAISQLPPGSQWAISHFDCIDNGL